MKRSLLIFAAGTAFLAAGVDAALACSGSPNDPARCINSGQAIEEFGKYFNDNLAPAPGSQAASWQFDDADTIVQRKATLPVSIPIEIISLNLISVRPIMVQLGSSANWNVTAMPQDGGAPSPPPSQNDFGAD